MASKIAVGFSGSFNSFGSHCKRSTRHRNYDCRSEPFSKPKMSLQKWRDWLKSEVLKMLSLFKDSSDTVAKPEDFTLEESKLIIRKLASEFDRITKESMSLCDGDCVVLGDLQKLWKKGKLQSILPVMDFYVWILLREHTQQGSIAKHWLRDNHRFRNRVALSYIPESVWEWILKASVQVTLDPSTANPCLKLSSNRKGVKMDKIIESLNNPFNGYNRSKTKYDGWWCVLGAEGYDSGRHYWEVNISGKQEWRIGAVKESAPRNGFTTLDITAGYWTLRLQLGRLLAMTSPVTKLERCAPSRLGVLLDIEEGQVSFYDAEERCHIYTFDVNFDHMGKVYPVFGTIETDRELLIV